MHLMFFRYFYVQLILYNCLIEFFIIKIYYICVCQSYGILFIYKSDEVPYSVYYVSIMSILIFLSVHRIEECYFEVD